MERGREIDARRRQIFRVLMATRATWASPAAVEALNAVPVEFYGPSKPALKSISDDWHSYLDLLGNKAMQPDLWIEKRKELFVALVYGMAKLLGYGFSKSEIEKDVYYPTGHAEIENDQAVIRRGFAQLFKGEVSLPMAVKEFPNDPDAFKGQVELHRMAREWFEGQRAVKVEGP